MQKISILGQKLWPVGRGKISNKIQILATVGKNEKKKYFRK